MEHPGTPSCVLWPAGSPFLPDRTPDPVRLTLSLFEILSGVLSCKKHVTCRKKVSLLDTIVQLGLHNCRYDTLWSFEAGRER